MASRLNDTAVCMVIPTFLPQVYGGAQLQVLRVSKALRRSHGMAPWVLTQRLGKVSALQRLNVNLPVRRVTPFKYPFGFLASSLINLVRERPDIIHIHTMNSPVILGYFASKLLRIPVVVKAPSSKQVHHFFAKPGSQRLEEKVDAFVALTPELEQTFLQNGVSKEKIWKIPNGIDTNEHSFITKDDRFRIRQNLDISPDAFIVSFAGRFVEEKNLEMLLLAWSSAVRSVGNGRMFLIGDGPQQRKLEAIVRSLDISDSVSFLGRLESVKVQEYISASDVFALPSRAEGMSNALLEAMALGTPVIVSEGAANKSMVEHLRTGMRINNTSQMQQAIVELYNHHHLRETLRLEARRNVMGQVSMERVAGLIAGLYTHLLER